MPAFAFKVVAREEGLKEGTIYAPSIAAARKSLLGDFERLLSIEPVRPQRRGRARYAPSLFTRQLSALLRCGIPTPRAIDLMADQAQHADFHMALADIERKVSEGHALSRTFEMHPRFFSPLYVAMCRVGEMRGDLPGVLLGLSEHQEMEESIKRRLSSAMTYPAIVLGITVALTIFLFNFVLPYFVDIFDAMKLSLPIYSAALVWAVRASNNPIAAATIALIVGLSVYLARAWLETAAGNEWSDRMKLRIPLVGPLLRKVIATRLAKTLALLLSGGVFVDVALEMCGHVVGNHEYEVLLARAQSSIRQGGGGLSDFFLRHGGYLIPRNFIEFLVAGEESGHLVDMLERLAQLYQNDIDNATKSFLTAVEPILVVVTGCLVGFIVISIFVPLYGLIGKM